MHPCLAGRAPGSVLALVARAGQALAVAADYAPELPGLAPVARGLRGAARRHHPFAVAVIVTGLDQRAVASVAAEAN